nr:DUF4919 domain-containing protein [Candidatus Kapabacteria bacterium]
KPDYDLIETEIAKEDSDLYYHKLMKRYLEADTTMTLDERRYLYYGYSFQKAYSPYGHSNYSDSLISILKKDELDSNDFRKVIIIADKVLKEIPFDLRTMNYKMYACRELEETELLYTESIKTGMLLDALLSTGDGVSIQTAYYVINTSHEYYLLSMYGLQFTSQALIEGCDYMQVSENEYGIEGIYFNVSACFRALNKMYDRNKTDEE